MFLYILTIYTYIMRLTNALDKIKIDYISDFICIFYHEAEKQISSKKHSYSV